MTEDSFGTMYEHGAFYWGIPTWRCAVYGPYPRRMHETLFIRNVELSVRYVWFQVAFPLTLSEFSDVV
jgi:hypothetical protein